MRCLDSLVLSLCVCTAIGKVISRPYSKDIREHAISCAAEGNKVVENRSAFINISVDFARSTCLRCDWKHVPLTLVMLFHNECSSLRLLVTSWLSFPLTIRDNVRLLIVDDNAQIKACNCIDSGGISFEQAGVTVLRIDDHRDWNIGGARNLGAFYTCSEYIFMCDIDAYISPSLLYTALNEIKQPSSATKIIQFNRDTSPTTQKVHPGIMVVRRDAYWHIGGCDEDFVGNYGVTDSHFRSRANSECNIAVRSIRSKKICTTCSPADTELKLFLPSLSRELNVNKNLYLKKINSQVPWSSIALRFSWHDDFCNTLDSKTFNNTFSKANQYASQMLASPLNTSGVFPLRFWKSCSKDPFNVTASLYLKSVQENALKWCD